MPIDLIKKLGPGGSFFQQEHTLYNYKQNLWLTEIFDKTLTTGKINEDRKRDILINANKKVKEIMSKNEKFRLPEDKEKEINEIVKRAGEIL